MSFVKKVHNRILEYYKNEHIDQEVKGFFLVCSGAVPVLLLVGTLFLVLNSNPVVSGFCFFIASFVGLLVAGAYLNSYSKVFAYIFCISMNFFFVPIMYFLCEGIYFGMIMFFVLGFIVTVLLIGTGKETFILIGAEFIYDILLIIFSCVHNESVIIGLTNIPHEISISISFIFVSIIIIFIFLYQNYINSELRKKVLKDNETIVKADNTKGRFLANITHEIRTPMNAIIGMTNLLLKEELSSTSRDSANLIKSESAKLLQIINNILEFSKLDSGRSEVINSVYSFRKMITEVINNVYQEYVNDDIKLHVFISKDIADKVFGDEIRVKQVLRYLLYGRLARTPGGTVNIDISSDYDEINCQITFKFKISSTGSGLSQDDVTAIYNAYSNYDSRQKTDYNRIGLEISICKKILNSMGGDLVIDSIEGIGNSFDFSYTNYVVDTKPVVSFDNSLNSRVLIYFNDQNQEYAWKRIIESLGVSANYARTPQVLKRMLETQIYSAIYVPNYLYAEIKDYIEEFNCESIVYVISDLGESIGDFGKCQIIRHPVCIFNIIETLDGSYNPENYAKSMEIEKYIYPKAKVMCVDDNNVNLLVLDTLLKEYGINATLCSSGKEALEILEKNQFDLLFIDQKMPEMDGVELVDRIKKLGNVNSSIPFICATADMGTGIRKELISVGFTDYLSKPINGRYLEKILRSYIPEDLRVVVEKTVPKKNSDTNSGANEQEKKQLDPLLFNPDAGISNLGGDKDAYLTVLESYYKEGVGKLTEVPLQYESGDISLYTTNVHALKSSSATVGCLGISPLFKALEFAGKENNKDFIENNSAKTFEYFDTILSLVKDYLSSEGITFEEETEADEADEGDTVSLDMDIMTELEGCIMSMNLRRTEEIISEISANNYGGQVNQVIKKIKNAYDNFEYNEIIAYIKELL